MSRVKMVMMAIALLAISMQGQANQGAATPTMVTCSNGSCNVEGCGCSHEGCDCDHGHNHAYRQLLGATRAVVISSDALTKISGDLAPRYNRTHVPAQRIHNSSLRLVGTLMSQHDNCGRWKRLVDLVNHKMKELARGYKLDHAQWKNAQVEHAHNTVSQDHAVFMSSFNDYFANNECVPNSVDGRQ